jgi:DNA-binding transcriptional LysR family regulator
MDGIENLRTFVAVADSGSLASAARHLRIAPSIVTKRIEQLEHRTSMALFTRSTRRVTLTEFGARYLSSVRRLMYDYDEVLADMGHAAQPIEGHIRIKVPTPMAVAYMADALAEFQQQYPRVSLEVMLVDRVVNPTDEAFDIALAGFPNSFAGVIDEPICPLSRVVCAAPIYLAEHGAPQHPRELVEHHCLVFSPIGKSWLFESADGPISVDLRPKLSSNDTFVLTTAAVHGVGIALLPSYAVAPVLRTGTLVRVLPEFPVSQGSMKALVPEGRAGIPRVRALLAFLKARHSPVPPWERDG